MKTHREPRDTLPRAVGYIYAASGGLEGFHTIKKGRRDLRAFCAHQGLCLAACEDDTGASRVSRRAVLNFLAAGGAEVLLLPALHHLSRNGWYAAGVLSRLLKRRQHVITCDGSFDSRTQPSRLMVSLMCVFAKVERENAGPTIH